jgi:hypothetical protein
VAGLLMLVQPLWVLGLVLVGASGSVLGGGEVSEAAVRSPGVVFGSFVGDPGAGFGA